MLALAVYGVYSKTAPLDVVRPTSQTVRPIPQGGIEPIPARLWEDPFLAHRRAQARAGEQPLTISVPCKGPFPPNREPGWRPDVRPLATSLEAEGRTLILAVITQAGSYAEDAENRKRSRYAVLSALGDTGYRAIDGEHLGAFALSSQPNFYDGAYGALTSGDYILPFERYERIEERSTDDDPEGWDTVVVVWVPDRILGEQPLGVLHGTLEGIQARVRAGGEKACAILGPTNSSDLLALVAEVGSCSQGSCSIETTPLISSWATISDAELDANWVPGEEPEVGKTRRLSYGFRLYRQTETDESLIVPLLDELRLRGIDPESDSIGLVTEWNTHYGQSFYETLRRNLEDDTHLTRFVYMQGIDGRIPLPSTAVDDDAAAAAELGGDDPLGRRQTDYLRRLVTTMGDEPFRAIGIVGSDVYDKLLVLRALRPHFPQTLFFTTDLDVRFLDQDERPWTRNLLIASHFGLDPNLELAKEDEASEGGLVTSNAADTRVLPMRGTYQVATFLACKRALLEQVPAGPERQSPREVQLFEIARTQAYNLRSSWNKDLSTWLLAALPALVLLGLFSGREVWDPRVSALLGERGLTITSLLFSGLATAALLKLAQDEGWAALPKLLIIPVIAVVVLFRVWSFFRQRIIVRTGGAHGTGGLEKAIPRNIAFGCLAYLIFGSMLYSGANLGAGEPLTLFEGISVWPSVAIRVVVILASASFLFVLNNRVERWDDDLERRFGLDLLVREETVVPKRRSRSFRCLRCILHRIQRYLGIHRSVVEARFGSEIADFVRHPIRFLFLHAREEGGDWVSEEGTQDIRKGWLWYRAKSERRIGRSVRAVLFFSGLVLATYYIEDGHGSLARGSIARLFNALTWWLSLLGVSLLLFFALDATQTCWRLLLPLTDPDRPVFWSPRSRRRLAFTPDRARNRVSEADKGSDSYMDGLLDVRFAADLTSGLASLVWYPFGLLALLILAQNSFFENWQWSASSMTLFAALALMLLVAAARLRAAAERLRVRALERLRQFKLHNLMEDISEPVDELEFAIDEVQATRRGAFLPFAQHPIITAILLPFGGVGTIALFEQFMG